MKSSCARTLLRRKFKLTAEQITALDAASRVNLAYPYWHQVQFGERNPFPVPQWMLD